MKNIKFISLVLACFLVFSGCVSKNLASNKPQSPSPVKGNNYTEDSNSKPVYENPSPQDYYQYIQEVMLPKHELASTESYEIPVDGNFDDSFWSHGKTGIVGADMRDYDNDGDLEMLVVELISILRLDTYFAPCFFSDPKTADIQSDERAFVFYATYLESKDNKIYEASHEYLSVLPTDGWGSMMLGIEKIAGKYYLFTNVCSENMSTYGPSYNMTYAIGDDQGSLYRCHVSPITAFNLSAGEAAKLVPIHNPINISSLSISDLPRNLSTNPTAEANREILGNRLLCFLHNDYPEYGGNKVIETITDYTNLRYYLENGGTEWQETVLPEGYIIEVEEAPNGMAAFVDELNAAAGTSFQASDLDGLAPIDGFYNATIEANDLQLTIKWNVTENCLDSICLACDYNDLKTGLWYDTKDALLEHSAFGLPSEETAMLKNESNGNDFINGVPIGNWICAIVIMDNARFYIRSN